MLVPTPGSESNSLSFSWTPADAGSGSFVTAIIVHFRKAGDAFGSDEGGNSFPTGVEISGTGDTASSNILGVVTHVVFHNLLPGTTYQARVRAFDDNGLLSPWTEIVQAVTAAAAPSAPSAELFTRTDDSLSLRWGAPHDGGRDITGYKVRWADASSPANYLNTGGASGVDADADARRYVLENLTAGTTYQAQVRAVNSIGDGDWSDVQERILPVKSGIKMAICIHPVGEPPATFDECLQAARNGYTINQSASGAQQFKISAFSFTAPPLSSLVSTKLFWRRLTTRQTRWLPTPTPTARCPGFIARQSASLNRWSSAKLSSPRSASRPKRRRWRSRQYHG